MPVIDVPSFRAAELRIVAHGRRSTPNPSTPPLTILASVPCVETPSDAALLGHQLSHSSSCIVSLRGNVITRRAINGLLLPWGPYLIVGLYEHDRRVEPQALTLRIARALNINQVVNSVVECLYELAYLPHLRLEVLSALPATFLCGTALETLLHHESLVRGRTALFAKDGTIKRMSFGVASTTDASTLRSKIEASSVAVEVEVSVLNPCP